MTKKRKKTATPPPTWLREGSLPHVLTEAEAAQVLRVSQRTVARYRAVGLLPSAKTAPGGSGRVLILREDLLAFIAARRGA